MRKPLYEMVTPIMRNGTDMTIEPKELYMAGI